MDFRIGWDEVFMTMAETLMGRSTCVRIQTAAILVRDSRIISIGYNGSAPGVEHCVDHWRMVHATDDRHRRHCEFDKWVDTEDFRDLHHEWAKRNELHAEQNAIIYAGRVGISTDQTTIYTVYSPCISCAKVILSAGIVCVKYRVEYCRDKTGIAFLISNGVKVEQI